MLEQIPSPESHPELMLTQADANLKKFVFKLKFKLKIKIKQECMKLRSIQ
jgi:hypothetical protein